MKYQYRKEDIPNSSLMDIILANARSINRKLLTRDADFGKANDAIVLE